MSLLDLVLLLFIDKGQTVVFEMFGIQMFI